MNPATGPTPFQIACDATLTLGDIMAASGESRNDDDPCHKTCDLHRARIAHAWRDLSIVERGRLLGLADDLRSLLLSPVQGNPSKDFDPALRHVLPRDAVDGVVQGVLLGEPDLVLTMLRAGSAFLSAELRIYLRAGCWEMLGEPAIAQRFLDRIASCDVANLRRQFRMLARWTQAMDRLDRKSEP